MQSRTLQALTVAANHTSFTGIQSLQSIEELTASLMQLDGVGHRFVAACLEGPMPGFPKGYVEVAGLTSKQALLGLRVLKQKGFTVAYSPSADDVDVSGVLGDPDRLLDPEDFIWYAGKYGDADHIKEFFDEAGEFITILLVGAAAPHYSHSLPITAM
jgi:hypothetical protein